MELRSPEKVGSLLEALGKAEGSELLPKVMLGMHNAEVVCLNAKSFIEECIVLLNEQQQIIDAVTKAINENPILKGVIAAEIQQIQQIKTEKENGDAS